MEPSFYAIIPANVRYDKDLTPNAKLLYGEITALCQKHGYCWATNDYFSNLYEVSKTSISKWISQLVSKGYISSKMIYRDGTKEIEQRRLTLVIGGIEEKLTPPIEEKLKDITTTSINTLPSQEYVGLKFVSIKDFKQFVSDFSLNKEYLIVAIKFWKLWMLENPNHTTTMKAEVLKWYDVIRKIIEIDKQKIQRLLAIYEYFYRCHLGETGYRNFWFRTVKSVGGLRHTNENGEYRLDKIIDEVNEKIAKDPDFGRLVENKIKQFKEHESIKLS